MPQKPLRPCRKIGCRELTREGYCKDHSYLEEDAKAERNKYYDKHKRNRKADAFYKSDEWERLRTYVINKYKGIDIFAYYIDKKIEYATTGHHIIELSENWELRLAESNIFPCNESNHNRIHSMYRKDKGKAQKLLRELKERFKGEMKINA